MLVSYDWLKRYVDINVSADVLAEKLTSAGITVDLVHYPGEMLTSTRTRISLWCVNWIWARATRII